MPRYLLFLLLLGFSVFAERNEPAPIDAPYNKVFDPWHACMAAEDLAKRGAPDALRTIFLSIYVRVNQPFLGGEGDETMVLVVQRVLASIGDEHFSAALAKQRPEIRSAVASFCSFSQSQLKPFPRT